MLEVFRRGPGFGVEVGHGVLRAALVGVKGGSRTLAKLDSVELPDGALADSFTKPNILDRASFVEAARKLAVRMGRRGGQVNVVLPDSVARVVMLDFEALPKKADDALKMIKWRLRKLMPFDIEEASLRYQYLGAAKGKEGESHRFVAAVVKSDILEQYEGAFGEAGLRPGRMEIASFAVWNLYSDFLTGENKGRPFGVLNMCCGKMTVMVFDGGLIRFFRLKDMGLEGRAAGQAEPDAQAFMRELRASLTYYQEHVSGSPVSAVYVAGQAGDNGGALSAIGAGTGLDIRALSIDKVISAGVSYRPADGVAYGAACGAALER